MTFNRMGTVPLPLALHLASYTVLGLFCFFAGSLNLIDPVKIPHGLMFLAVCVFSWGYVFGILMARKEVVILGFLASAAWLIAAAARPLPHAHPGALRAAQPMCLVSTFSGAAGSSTTNRAPPSSESSIQIFPPTSVTTR